MKFNHGKWIKDYKLGKVNEAPMARAFPKMKTAAQRKAAGVKDRKFDSDPDSRFDFDYYNEQVGNIFTELEEFEQAIMTDIEYGVDDGSYQDLVYEQMPDQIRRYLRAAEKQLDSLQKYLDRQQRRVPK